MHVFDKALNWHKQFNKRFHKNATWERYDTEVKRRFDLVLEDSMDIGLAVRMLKPVNLPDVYCLAKMQEATIAVFKSRSAPLLATPKTSHKCSGQLYSLEVIGGIQEIEEDEDMQLTKEGVMNAYTTNLIDEPPLISLNALSVENTYRIMRVKGFVRKNVAHTLIDCGSTHNFLYWNTARKLRCKLRKISLLEVSVANGHVMNRCEMVLEIQWLSTLRWIRCDFKNLVTEYTYNNKKIVLRGTHQTTLQWMQGKQKKGGKTMTVSALLLLCSWKLRYVVSILESRTLRLIITVL
ncbi:hypothetical protein Tco_0612538 [Tanacetum coccineum]